MRSLHVAALPFPSPQGTQGAVRAMLKACAAVDRDDVHLLVYPRAAGAIDESAFDVGALGARVTLHRPQTPPWMSFARPSLRSGPSAQKLVLDVALALALRRLVSALRPEIVIAHHVEACAAVLAVRARPLVFVAHTELAAELPSYARGSLAPLLTRAGAALDRGLVARADAVAAVAPGLAARLHAATGGDVATLALPWPVPAPTTIEERSAARHALGLSADAEVVLYAGNLDRYQGVPLVLDGLGKLARRRAAVRVLVATESTRAVIAEAVRSAGLSALVVFSRLDTEATRRRVHAAADVAIVPRAVDGGVPVKLLDALARGVPVVAQRRALGGLALSGCASVCADDDADALDAALGAMLAAPIAAREVAQRGRAYVTREHSAGRFRATLDAVVARASTRVTAGGR